MRQTLIIIGLLAALSTSALAWDDDRDAYGSRRGGYNGTYPDGSSRPINPGPGGQWNDDEYFARKRSEGTTAPAVRITAELRAAEDAGTDHVLRAGWKDDSVLSGF